MSSAVDVTITRGATIVVVRGWVAPKFSTAAGEQPAELYLEDATPGLVAVGDLIAANGISSVVERVGWWPPDSIEAVLASAVLGDACTIERVTAQTLNTGTNVITTTWSTIWSGPCAAQLGAGITSTPVLEVAGELVTVMRGEVQIPAALADVQAGDRVTLTTSADPRLVGRHLTVTGVQMATTPALRVLNVVEEQ